ncbi:HEAT repeat domain-containing protein [Myroides sp. LJL119]
MKLNTQNYKQVLKALRLPEYWEDRLSNKNEKSNAETLRILDTFGENVSGSAVSHKLSTNQKTVRKHAKSVFMNFNSNNAYKFLENDFDSDFNPLDEVRIHTALCKRQQTETLPGLIRWVALAKNESYKAFLIKEIGFFKQTDSIPRLIESYIETDSVVIKKQIVETLGELKASEAVDLLTSDYQFSEMQVQFAIIKALGAIGNSKCLPFLEQIYHTTSNKEILISVLTQIYLTDQVGTTYLRIKSKTQSEFEKSLVAYVEMNTTKKIS